MFSRLRSDIQCILERDPAARTRWEVLTCYPGLHALVQAQAARYADTAALFQALGGGWWNRGELANAAIAPGQPAQPRPATQAAAQN